MTTIELGHGYFIEEDPLNYTLKQRFTSKSNDGAEKESIRVCGFYGDITDAVKRFVTLVRLDSMDEMVISMREYVKALERHEKEITDRLEKLFNGYPVK